MKYLILVFALLATSASADTFFAEPDKQKHMAAHAIGTNGLHLVFDMSPGHAWLTMMAAGVLYEVVTNESTVNESLRDMKANALGGATVFVWKIEWGNSGKVNGWGLPPYSSGQSNFRGRE